MPTYILDLLVRRAQIKQACNRLVRPVWLMVKSDGVHQAFNTKKIPPSEVLQWEAPARLILNIQNIKESVLQVSLCTLNESYNQNLVVASSQILLSSLPFLNPKTISFPLMSSCNITETAAIVTMTATISLLPNVNEQKSSYQSNSMNSPYSNSMQQSQFYNQDPDPEPPIYEQYGQQNQRLFNQQQQMNYSQNDYQYNQSPYNNQYYQQYHNQPYQQQQMQYDMPINPYKMHNSQNGPPGQKKVRYPPFPPIQPAESSFLYNVDSERRQNSNQQVNRPRVIHTKRGK